MRTIADRFRSHAAVLMTLLTTALLLLAACGGNSDETPSTIDLEPFKELAKASDCADTRNQLFLIDDQLVFWDRAGSCPDAAYSQTLYGGTPDQVLCTLHDSIAGPMKDCQDEQYLDLFDAMTANLAQSDLGLGSEHTVQPVPF